MGMMPHPERAADPLVGGTDGLVILHSLVSATPDILLPTFVRQSMSTITADVIAAHQLTESEYDKILSLLGREPTLTELGIFSVMWSEHCSYKSSRIHLKKLPTRKQTTFCRDREKTPASSISATASRSRSRSNLTITPVSSSRFRARPPASAASFATFSPWARARSRFWMRCASDRSTIPRQGARNRRILEGVVSGIAHYGNCFGVPTIGGECVFEDCYDGNPLVNVFALGVFRHDEIFYGKATGIGNPVIYVGAKTGRDGIHGASMASAEFTEESKQKRPNVQVGDPFMEKLLLEACLEAMKTGAIVGIQDMGAAGLTCSTCEMGSRARHRYRDRSGCVFRSAKPA